MFKKVLAMILTLCLVAELMPAMVFAESTGGLTVENITINYWENGAGTVTETWIFANGNPISIEAKGTGSVIKDAQGNELTPTGFTNNSENGYNLSKVGICGGKHGDLTGNTSVKMNSGSVGSIIGGCYGGSLAGNSNVTISGGVINSIRYGTNIAKEDYWETSFFSVIGGSFAGNESTDKASGSVSVTGDVNLTITAGELKGYEVAACMGVSYKNSSQITASVKKVLLSITGGTFTPAGELFVNQRLLYDKYSTSDSIEGGTYAKILGKITVNTNDVNSSMKVTKTIWLKSRCYLITDDQNQNAYMYDSLTKSDTHYIMANDATKKYVFKENDSPQIFENCTIPQGYVMEVPTGVTLTVNSGVDVTNNGTVSIRGTLINNGSILGSGYIFKRAGGIYTPGAGAVPSDVPLQIDAISTMTIEKGQTRGTAKITDISAEDGCTYYYRVYDSEQLPPKEGEPFNAEGFTVVNTNTEFIARLNDVTAVYEVKDGKVQKYSSVHMTQENLCGPINYDPLDTAIVGQGDADNTTKITASADTGNTLYYKLSDSVQGSGYVYNTKVETSALTQVVSGADITSEAGKYISIYELDTNGYLKKFASVQLTNSNFRYYTGGLVADTINKRIYCNGAKVAFTSASYQDYCQLYVYADGQWKAAVPRNLDFISGAGFSDYTLYGGSAEDSPEVGTLYILTVRAHASMHLPKDAEGFANYIIPNFNNRSATNWYERYLVKGDIDLNSCPYGQCWSWSSSSWSVPCYIQSITLKDNAHLTLNTGNGPTFIMEGQYTDIVKGENATITNIQKLTQLTFIPSADIKLFDKDGKEFSKDSESGKYQIPKDTQVTIAGAVSLKGAAASFGEVQQPVLSAPKYADTPQDDDFNDYSIGFYSNNTHKYYTGNDVDRKMEGTGENAVKRVKVTLANFNDYRGWNIELRNYNGDTVEGCKYGAINTSISFDLGKSATLPPAPTNGVVDDTANTFTFTAATGYDEASLYEYSTDGGVSWNNCTSFIINVGNIPVPAGKLQVRVKSTAEVNSGNVLSSTKAFTAVLEGTTSITGVAKVGETLMAETQGVQTGAVLHYQWKAGGVNIGADKNTYTVAGSNIGKTITVTITADGYMGELASSATDVIGKGSAQSPNLGTLNISNRLQQVYRFNLKSLLTNGADFGNVTYSVVSGGATDYYPAVTDSNISDGILSITVGDVESSDEKSVGNITVKITSQYYEDMQANININSTNKMVPTTEVKGVFHYVYGEKLSDRSITGSASLNGDPVYGKFVWTSPVYKVKVSDTSAKWSFIPDDMGKYVANEGMVDITVSKATLSGTPLFTAIKEAGKKLSEVALTAPLNWPSGSFAWTEGADTVVAANIAYGWMFTPDDTDNYNVITGTATPYTVSAGGNSSGGGHSHGGSTSGSVVKPTEPAKSVEKPAQKEAQKSLETVKKDGAEKVKSLKDVKESSWFYEGAVYSLGNGWFAGTTETTFSPSKPMTREMFRIVLGRMGADTNDLMDNNRLKENITKEQLVTLLYRMAQKKGLVKTGGLDTQNISTFVDGTQVSSWSKEAMAWANAQGIIKGNDRNMITPKAGTNRAEVAVMLMRFDTIARNHY
ncbi:MAG: S-layer homology domain-containing protein [Aminipila sp.]